MPGKDRAHFLTLEIENLCTNISKSEVAKFLEHNIEALTANQKVSQLQRSSFQWFHESQLPLDAITLATPARSPLITDLQNYMTMVLLLQENLTNQQTKYQGEIQKDLGNIRDVVCNTHMKFSKTKKY